MKSDNPIAELLAAPLSQEWTVDLLAEQILESIAERSSDFVDEIILDDEQISDRQSRRLLRPLLARLAEKSAAEAGTSPNIFRGSLSFERQNENGAVWISGEFENTSARARVAFQRSVSMPSASPIASLQGELASRSTAEERGFEGA